MAVSRGKESTEITRQLFMGIASSYIVAVNPTKEEYEKITGRTLKQEPIYVGTTDIDGTQVPSVRLDFICKIDPEKYVDSKGQPINTFVTLSIHLRKQYVVGKNSGKYQIIDNYGRTAWATKEDIDKKIIPVYNLKSGGTAGANISKDYKPALTGLEGLTKLIRAYLNIPTVEKWENNKVVGLIDNPADAEVMPECIENYFKGDFTELKEIFGYQPNNKVKIVIGIKNDNGKQYHSVYNQNFLKNNITDYSKIDKEIMEAKAANKYANIEFECTDLHEYIIAPSNLTPNSESMPNTENIFGSNTPWNFNG